MEDQDLLGLTADIVTAMVSNNKVAASELPDLIAQVHTALGNTSKPVEVETPKQEPAVSVRSSIKHDYLVCLEDGAKLKMLKRYLMTNYAMTPEDYRAKWGLPKDYPMVAPAYAETRRALAVSIGLGRKQADILLAEPSAVIPKAKGKPGRPKKADDAEPAKKLRIRVNKAVDTPVDAPAEEQTSEG